MTNNALQRIADTRKRVEFAQEWDKRLKRLGLSPSEFCRLHNIDRADFSRWVNGTRIPDDDSVAKVERRLRKEEERFAAYAARAK